MVVTCAPGGGAICWLRAGMAINTRSAGRVRTMRSIIHGSYCATVSWMGVARSTRNPAGGFWATMVPLGAVGAGGVGAEAVAGAVDELSAGIWVSTVLSGASVRPARESMSAAEVNNWP